MLVSSLICPPEKNRFFWRWSHHHFVIALGLKGCNQVVIPSSFSVLILWLVVSCRISSLKQMSQGELDASLECLFRTLVYKIVGKYFGVAKLSKMERLWLFCFMWSLLLCIGFQRKLLHKILWYAPLHHFHPWQWSILSIVTGPANQNALLIQQTGLLVTKNMHS